MVSKTIWLGIASLSLAFVTPVHARQIAQDSVYSPVFIRELQESLREYARAQERYYGGNARYASRLNATKLTLGPRQRVVVLTSTPTGHSGIATHLDAPGVICGIYVGTAPPPLDPESVEGVPSCNGGNRASVESPRVTSAARANSGDTRTLANGAVFIGRRAGGVGTRILSRCRPGVHSGGCTSDSPTNVNKRRRSVVLLPSLLRDRPRALIVEVLSEPVEHPLPMVVIVGDRARSSRSVPARRVVHPHDLLPEAA